MFACVGDLAVCLVIRSFHAVCLVVRSFHAIACADGGSQSASVSYALAARCTQEASEGTRNRQEDLRSDFSDVG